MRALLTTPQGDVQLDVDIPALVDAIVCGGQVFERSPLAHPTGAVAYRQVRFVNLDAPALEALAIAHEALRLVKQFFVKLETDLPRTDPLRKLREKFHAPVHRALDNALALTEEALRDPGAPRQELRS